jgi:hypothetical protein
MASDINWLLAESPAKLSNIGYRSIVQGPQRVLVEGLDALL